jgi:hypothetical protein
MPGSRKFFFHDLIIIISMWGPVLLRHRLLISVHSFCFSRCHSLVQLQWVPYRYFFQGLTALSLFKVAGKRKYRKRGTAIVRRMEKWVSQGVINCQHMLLLLRAEALSGSAAAKSVDVARAFDDAIAMAGKLGFLHNQALANERAGVYFLEQGDCMWASTYLTRARECFSEWGAKAKVEQMNVRYKDLFQGACGPRIFKTLKAHSRLGLISKDAYMELRMDFSSSMLSQLEEGGASSMKFNDAGSVIRAK